MPEPTNVTKAEVRRILAEAPGLGNILAALRSCPDCSSPHLTATVTAGNRLKVKCGRCRRAWKWSGQHRFYRVVVGRPKQAITWLTEFENERGPGGRVIFKKTQAR